MTKNWFAMVAVVLAAACGGDGGGASGVDGGKRVVSLGDSEKREVCEWVLATRADHDAECERDSTLTECIAEFDEFSSGCTVTVSQLEGCVEAIAASDCDAEEIDECLVFDACE
jgi:hypothetical protein